MERKVYQYIFQQNESNDTWAQVVTGEAFQNQFVMGVDVLGIHARPGTRFKLNDYPGWVVVGPTGVFELDITNKSFITSLSFDANSVHDMKTGIPGVALIVDIIYREE